MFKIIKHNHHTLSITYRDDSDLSVIDEFFVDKMYRSADQLIAECREPILDIGAHIGMFSIYASILNPKVKIIGHPTGRLLDEREGYEVDWDKVFSSCLKNKKALEINAWPQRLDLPDVLVREAVKNGVKMVINSDSHQADQMFFMRYGVSVARRGWATKADILNSLSYNEFSQWLKNK